MGISSLTGGLRVDRTSCQPFGQIATSTNLTGDSAYHTLVSISGHGFLDHAWITLTSLGNAVTLRITVDGVVKFLGGMAVTNTAGYFVGVQNKNLIGMGYNGNHWMTNGNGTTALTTGTILVMYPYTTNTAPSSNAYLALASDSIYFTTSLLIEYMTGSAMTANFSYQGGSY